MEYFPQLHLLLHAVKLFPVYLPQIYFSWMELNVLRLNRDWISVRETPHVSHCATYPTSASPQPVNPSSPLPQDIYDPPHHNPNPYQRSLGSISTNGRTCSWIWKRSLKNYFKKKWSSQGYHDADTVRNTLGRLCKMKLLYLITHGNPLTLIWIVRAVTLGQL